MFVVAIGQSSVEATQFVPSETIIFLEVAEAFGNVGVLVIQLVPSETSILPAVLSVSERVEVEVIQFVPSLLNHFKAVLGASDSVAVEAIQLVPSLRIVLPEVALALGKVGVDHTGAALAPDNRILLAVAVAARTVVALAPD